MNRLVESVALAVVLACVAVVMNFVLSRNLAAGIYPVHADSIGIPLFESLSVSLEVWAVASIALVLFGRRKWLSWFAFALLAIASVLSALYGLSWLTPHHWEIAASYLMVAIIVGWRLVIRVNRLRVTPNEP